MLLLLLVVGASVPLILWWILSSGVEGGGDGGIYLIHTPIRIGAQGAVIEGGVILLAEFAPDSRTFAFALARPKPEDPFSMGKGELPRAHTIVLVDVTTGKDIRRVHMPETHIPAYSEKEAV